MSKGKGNPHYRKGYKFELKVRDYLQDHNYAVFRTAGSHTIADLICFSPNGSTILVQCKTTNRMTKKAIREFKEFAQSYLTAAVIASNNRGKIDLQYL
jgi:Holliday junction resolvase